MGVWALVPLLFFVTASHAASPDRYAGIQKVFAQLEISEEPSFAGELRAWDGAQTRQGFETILKYADPTGWLPRYASWDERGVSLFLDRDTKQRLDVRLEFKQDGNPDDRKDVIGPLRRAAFNPPSFPLQGLRIALDPGHMGGKIWDHKTGKYIKVPGGYVSEGAIAFQSCMLLMRELRRLGAEVRITRKELGPVTDLPLESYDLSPFATNEIRANTDQPWFDQLLAQPEKAAQHPEIRALRSDAKRDYYFIMRADLAARARLINSFKPHLTLVVHFDASETNKLQSTVREVRAYVPGNILNGELSSREQRAKALRTLVDGHRWMESSVFSTAIVKGIADATGAKIKDSPLDFQAIRVGPGVYARNLALNRLVSEGVMSYVEVLNYDFAAEFWKLAKIAKHTEVDGVQIDYPQRLEDFVEGMKQGILDYVRSMEKPTLVQLQ